MESEEDHSSHLVKVAERVLSRGGMGSQLRPPSIKWAQPMIQVSIKGSLVLKIETWLNGIGLKRAITECPVWPPDLFALAGALLLRSGAYLHVFKHRSERVHPQDVAVEAAKWRDAIDSIVAATVDVPDAQAAVVPSVNHGWAQLMAAKETLISEIDKMPNLAQVLIRLALIADEASVGIGIDSDLHTPSRFLSIAEVNLFNNASRSFCWEVDSDVLCVLGKQHTPQKGATFRSLSHHLALYLPNEIEGRWINATPKSQGAASRPEMLNLLLLPWPTQVETDDFQEVSDGSSASASPDDLSPGFFRYRPALDELPEAFGKRLKTALDKGRRHAGTIDAIVLPELAMTHEQYDAAERVAFAERCILVGGLRRLGKTENHWDANISVLQASGAARGPEDDPTGISPAELRLFQAKHHRWYLDRQQIVSYQLAGHIRPSRGYWEYIDLPERVLHFVTLRQITWSVLICEDLARQDPAANLIRAVGPNLLIALLMDGPQLGSRWSARYASVLADDPGTSVLSLTSLGMARRSRPFLKPGERASPSRVIGLWRDALEGEVQIMLDPEDDGCVLSLECRLDTEFCADGRGDGGQSCYPVYAGYRSFNSQN